jgi:hypothetical protein
MPVTGTKYMMMRKNIFSLRVLPQRFVASFFMTHVLQLAEL